MTTHFSSLAWLNPMDRGAWKATVHGIAKSWARQSMHALPVKFLKRLLQKKKKKTEKKRERGGWKKKEREEREETGKQMKEGQR